MTTVADSSVMFLALLLKEVGGEYVVQRDTFMNMPDEFEIMIGRTSNQDVKISLIEDESLIKQIRDKRRHDALKQKIVVP